MLAHKVPDRRPHSGRSGLHRLLPATGIAVVAIALVAHLAGGAALVHLGLGSSLGDNVLVIGLAAVVCLKLLLVVAARRWWQQR